MKISLFNRHVTVLDYAFLDDHKGVIGDSLWVNVTFIGETDHEGVVYDFSLAKKKVKEIIDLEVDHRLVVPNNIGIKKEKELSFEYKYGFDEKFITYKTPREGICEIPFGHVSKANLQTHIENLIMPHMPNNILNVQIELVEEDLTGQSVFHYTHGLKDHYGNCQRLFHGHRNTIEVMVNNQRDQKLESHIAKELLKGNIHFCFYENVVNKSELEKVMGTNSPEGVYENIPMVEIKYKSSQGEFSGSVPGQETYFLQSESTVENLSIHFAKYVKTLVGKNSQVQVRTYEGIGKGAVTTL